MRFPSARYWSCLFLSTLTVVTTEAQSSQKDSTIFGSAYAVAVRQYHMYVAPEVGLYRGIQYVDYDHTVQKGQPFLGPNLIRLGSVWYGGVAYHKVAMEYDLVEDQLVVMDPLSVFKISLYMDLVDSFSLDGHLYFRLKDSLAPSSMRSGFWDRLYQGRIVLLKRERKVRNENIVISSDNVRYFIDSSVSFYLRKGNVYHPVNTKRELFDAFTDRKRGEIRRVIRRSGLNWHDGKEALLWQVAAWYDGVAH